MKKTYTYPRLSVLPLIASIIVIYGFTIMAKGFLAEALASANLLPKLIAAVIGLFCGSCTVRVLMVQIMNLASLRKVIVDDENLIIQKFSSSRAIRWEDIKEFGTYTVGPRRQRVRGFYLKARGCGDQSIEVCTQQLDNLKDLIDTIFLRAINAEFFVVENLGRLPFTKQIQLQPWDRRNHSFPYADAAPQLLASSR